jgi:nucleoside-diphosphate-sugar epimerase
MKIAITGHSAGIGQALSNRYLRDGHEIVGLSRRTGYNIRSVPKVADQIEACDMFINNAQVGFAQTELLFEMASRWTGTGKIIVVISTMMTQYPTSILPGLDMDQYRVQKVALEEAIQQIRHQKLGLKIILVRPGDVATDSSKTVPPSADVNVWANTLVDILAIAKENNLSIPDISLGPKF